MKDPSAQFHIVGGAPQEDGPFIGLVSGGASAKSDGASPPAYLLLEPVLSFAEGPSTPHGLSLCNDAKGLVSAAFGRSGASLTARLRDGLKVVHERTVRENEASLPEHKVGFGAACVAVRGGELYIAQSGPTLVYIINENGVERMAPPPHLPAGAGAPLGMSRELPVRLYRCPLTRGSVVLLAFSGLAEAVQPQELYEFFRRGMREGVAEVYRRVRDSNYFAALAVVPEIQSAAALGLSRPEANLAAPADDPFPVPSKPDFVETRAPGRRTAKGAPKALGIKLKDPPRLKGSYARSSFNLGPGLFVKTGALLVVLLALLWLLGGGVVKGAEEARFASLIAEAKQLQGEAADARTKDRKRRLLAESKLTLQAALELRKEHPQAVELLESVNSQISQMDSLYVLEDTRLLVDFQSIGPGSPQIRDINAGNGNLYLLDKGRDQVYQVSLLEDPPAQGGGEPIVVSKGRQSAYRNLSHLLWMPKGSLWTRDSIMALDDRKRLLEYTASGDIREVPLRGAQEWSSFQGAVGYGGNLYILDPGASQVWRYVPTDGGFDSERKAVLSGVDVRDAVDMAVDGDIYILQRAGKIVKYAEGRPETLAIDGLDRPLSSPSAIFGTSHTKFLYVVDRGNGRIVALDRNGVFQQQFTAPGISSPQDVYVDEANNYIYICTDSKLYRGTLPSGGIP